MPLSKERVGKTAFKSTERNKISADFPVVAVNILELRWSCFGDPIRICGFSVDFTSETSGKPEALLLRGVSVSLFSISRQTDIIPNSQDYQERL